MRPPFEITPTIIERIARLERLLGRIDSAPNTIPEPKLRRSARVKTIQASLQIEGNSLSEEQVTAILEGRRVAAPALDLREIRNANAAYDRLESWSPEQPADLLEAHGILMAGLIESAGHWRSGGVGVIKGSQIAHVAPPAGRVPILIEQLLEFAGSDLEIHPAIRASVCHYELEFIHPFDDGNGRAGRLWHSLILTKFHPVFAHVPVESVVRDRQEEYYRVLGQSDAAGASTPFVEFALTATRDALEDSVAQFSKQAATPESRLTAARSHFGDREFARKAYMELHSALSTASASRDLRFGVESGWLQREGDKSLARYRFAPVPPS